MEFWMQSEPVFDHQFEKYIEYSPPESEFERILQFHRLVLLSNIDEETNAEEILFLNDIGIRLGWIPDAGLVEN